MEKERIRLFLDIVLPLFFGVIAAIAYVAVMYVSALLVSFMSAIPLIGPVFYFIFKFSVLDVNATDIFLATMGMFGAALVINLLTAYDKTWRKLASKVAGGVCAALVILFFGGVTFLTIAREGFAWRLIAQCIPYLFTAFGLFAILLEG